jgi:cell division protein FtsL
MVDWAGRIEARNYKIRRESDSPHMKELLRIILSLVMVSGVLFYYSWVRSHIVSIGYESQNLKAAENTLLRTQKSLILEEETLKNPERIDRIARGDLNLVPLHPNQLIPLQIQDVESSAAGALVLAAPPPASGEFKNPSASN